MSETTPSTKSLSLGYHASASACAFVANNARRAYTRSTQSRDGVSRRVICCLARNSNVVSEVKMDTVIPPMLVMRVLMSRALRSFSERR